MLSNDGFKPLVSIGMTYIFESNPDLSAASVVYLEQILDLFVNRKLSQFDASNAFIRTIGNTNPLEKIIRILTVGDNPLLKIDDYPEATKALLLTKRSRQWTEIEDQRLLAGIHRFGLEAWGSVAAFVGNSRTKAQCNQRWTRGLDPRLQKIHWTQEEDRLLMWAVEKNGEKSWTKISQEMGKRSDVQCRYRYKQLMEEQKKNEPVQENKVLNNIGQFPLLFSDTFIPNNKKTLPSISTLIPN